MTMRHRLTLTVAITALLASSAAADRISTVDGRQLEGEITAIDDQAVRLTADGDEQTVGRKDVLTVTLGDGRDGPTDIMTRRKQTVLETVAGDRLAVSAISLVDSTFTAKTSAFGKVTMEVNSIAAIYAPGSRETGEDIVAICEEMKLTEGTHDRMLVIGKDDKRIPLHGVLGPIGPNAKRRTSVTFTWHQRDREIELTKVRAILLATAVTDETPVAGELLASDGSRVRFTAVTMAEDKIVADSPQLGQLTVPRKKVDAVRFYSDRVASLTEIQPAEVTEHGMLGEGFGHRIGRNAHGKALRLDGREYASGLGSHSFSELTFALEGEFATFTAIAGIDDAARPRGDATLTILGDGKQLVQETLTGNDAAKTIRLDIKGVKRLTIRVEFGADNLDVGDLVDLVEARLVK
ncbi:MAG: NPCBM/NEW2 domain-containing protein [Planctomycetota bacterium]|jgi:hypothetical protein